MAEYHDTFLDGNELIEAAIDRYYRESSKETLIAILDTIRQRMHADGHFILPVLVDEEDENRFSFRSIQTKDGKVWNAAFTSQTELFLTICLWRTRWIRNLLSYIQIQSRAFLCAGSIALLRKS